MVWVHPKTAKTVSSTTGALVGAGSLKPPESKPDFLLKMFLGEKHGLEPPVNYQFQTRLPRTRTDFYK
jgi:hypothetical protein